MADSPRFASLRPEMQEAVAKGEEKVVRLMRERSRSVPARTTLVQAGHDHGFVYRLRKGWAARLRTLPDGRSQLILIFLPGDLVAVKSMFFEVQQDSIETLSDAVLEQVEQKNLRTAFENDREVAARCIWQVLEEEHRLHDWVVSLGRGSAEERLASLLLDFRARLILSGSIPPDALSYDLPMTQEQLGDHLGITTVHVNRVLRSLRKAGLLTIKAHKVYLDDLEGVVQLGEAFLGH